MWQRALSWLRPDLWRAGRDYWLAQAAGWGLLWLVNVIAASSAHRQFLPWATCEIFLCLLLAMSGTHALRAVIRRGRWLELSPGRLAARLAGLILLLAVAVTGLNELLDRGLPKDEPVLRRRQGERAWEPGLWVAQLAQFSVTVGFWVILYVGHHQRQRQRARELEFWQLRAALADAELQALRAQVNPHFLFNCLNGLRALVTVDPGRAQDAVTRLAGLLRYALQSGHQRTVPLGTEWRMVEDYVALETMRFEDALLLQTDLDPATLVCPVPPMAVQTLVENAIKHGLAGRRATGTSPEPITVRGWLDTADGALVLEVVNVGTLAMSDPDQANGVANPETTGLGLHNVRERLRRLFGPGATLELSETPPGRVIARLRVPPAMLASSSADGPTPARRGQPAAPIASILVPPLRPASTDAAV